MFFRVLFAVIILVLISWFFVLVAGLLFLFQKKVFFCQSRPGKDENPFTIIKFCTMYEKQNLNDADRVTRIGKILRKFHIDELPQLINIVKGEMAFVGPRPLLMEYLPLYNQRQRLRHNVLPGITGWSQIQYGRYGNWYERLEADVWYVENQSVLLDCKIIAKTIWGTFNKRNLSETSSPYPLFEKFKGNQ